VLLGLALVGLGGLWLLGSLLGLDAGHFLWPFFVIVPGVVLFVLGLTVRSDAGLGLMIPGAIVTTTGLLLFYQNVSGHWASWAYAWALIAPTSIGVALMIDGARRGQAAQVQSGRRLVRIGLILFAALGVFFELIIGISGFRWGGWWWAVLFIGAGLVLLVAALLPRRKL
jgi:hypothetical protein